MALAGIRVASTSAIGRLFQSSYHLLVSYVDKQAEIVADGTSVAHPSTSVEEAGGISSKSFIG